MRKNILTIDFDIIMWPSVELYSKLPDSPWEEKLNRFPTLNNCIIDYELYYQLTKLIVRLSKKVKKENIYFITDHDEIIKYLSLDDSYNVLNIDHHHDWYYDKKDAIVVQNLNCGNWVKYLNENFILNNYLWVDSPNSMIEKELENIQIFKCFSIMDFDFDNIEMTPDFLFISLSPAWVPPYIAPLFNAWKSICE